MKNLTTKTAIYIDLELTCWQDQTPIGNTNEIIQIGIVEADLVNLSIIHEDRYYVIPKSEISEYCTNLTGITQSDISDFGMTFESVMKAIKRKYAPMNKVTLAWGDDSTMLSKECFEKAIPNPFREFLDFGTIFKLSMGTNCNYSLPQALSTLNLTFQGLRHDGLIDAKNLCALHLEFARRVREN